MSSITENIEDNKKWHPAQEKILKNWGEIAACYRYLHFRSFERFKRQSMRFTLPVIVLSTITGTANFAQSTFPTDWQEYVPAAIGALNLIAAIMTTISQFLKVNELQESHRVSSIQYGKLSRSIRLELMLPSDERHKGGSALIDSARGEYDRLIEQSPPIPRSVLNDFEFFMSKLKNGNSVCTPEILDVRMIKPYAYDHREWTAVNKSLDALKVRSKQTKSHNSESTVSDILKATGHIEIPSSDHAINIAVDETNIVNNNNDTDGVQSNEDVKPT